MVIRLIGTDRRVLRRLGPPRPPGAQQIYVAMAEGKGLDCSKCESDRKVA
ncbi:MAG: hypothetical protein ABJC19_10370 [Gemmatimonadota bacterium]